MRQPKLPVQYRVFLLRAWQEEAGSPEQMDKWRFSLQETESLQRTGFDNLDALIAYLRNQWSTRGEYHEDGEEK